MAQLGPMATQPVPPSMNRPPRGPWVADARTAWHDVSAALDEQTGRFRDPRVRRHLTAALRAKPEWFDATRRGSTDDASSVTLAPFEVTPREDGERDHEHTEDGGKPSATIDALVSQRVARGSTVDGYLLAVGDGAPPSSGNANPSDAQLPTLWARARTLVRELNAATTAAHEQARRAATEDARALATATEESVTAMVRPLARAMVLVQQPAADAAGRLAFGGSLGLGLVVLGALALWKR